MALNAAGLDVAGSANPKWKGRLLLKVCEVCAAEYSVKRVHANSRFCSLKCVGVSQRGRVKTENVKREIKECVTCGSHYSVPSAHAHRYFCCSKSCSYVRRSSQSKGARNPNWNGGLSRFPYPWNFREISRRIIERDGARCRNPNCAGTDRRLTTHHINYDKQDCNDRNLICLCSACNSKANFGRDAWQKFYEGLLADMYPLKFIAIQARPKKDGGGWKVEEF